LKRFAGKTTHAVDRASLGNFVSVAPRGRPTQNISSSLILRLTLISRQPSDSPRKFCQSIRQVPQQDLRSIPPASSQYLRRKIQGMRGGAGGEMLACSMATLSERHPANAPGRYYVDATCIDCDQCRVLAPQFFAHNEDDGISLVSRQPVTPEEIALVEEAIAACATESIGKDGV
jgi:ferredoxin